MDTLSIYKEFYIGVLGHAASYKEIDIVSLYTEGLVQEVLLFQEFRQRRRPP